MIGVNLLWCFLAAWFGGMVLATLGSLKALVGGEVWSWAKFGISLLLAFMAAASYWGIAWAMPASTSLWVAIFAALCYGMGIEATQNQTVGLVRRVVGLVALKKITQQK
jgi:hypothetical protein